MLIGLCSNSKRMSLAIPLKLYDRMKEHTEETHETVNSFIRRSIAETIDNDEKHNTED